MGQKEPTENKKTRNISRGHTGMDDGLLITTISSSFRMNLIGSFTTGGSCLENGNNRFT